MVRGLKTSASIFLLASLASCFQNSKNAPTTSSDGKERDFSRGASAKKKVLTSFTIIADIARNVAGDAADVDSITKPGAEIHGYEPTPKDIVRAQHADLVLWNGMNLE